MYTEMELNSLIADVEREFTSHLAKAEDSFKPKAKDESEKKEESKEEKPEEKKIESEKPEDKGAQDQNQEKAGESQPPKEEAKASAEEPNSEEKPSEDQEDHGYDEEDLGHMDKMYMSMSKAELRAHHDAVRKAMDGHGLAKCEDSMAKSEKDLVVEIAAPTEEVSLLKSELEAVKAKSAEEKKNLEAAVQTFLTKFVEKTVPAGKAITSLDIIAKTENGQDEKPLQKGEIDAKLLEKAKNPSLSKSDRDAINSYYFNKNVGKISHLLK